MTASRDEARVDRILCDVGGWRPLETLPLAAIRYSPRAGILQKGYCRDADGRCERRSADAHGRGVARTVGEGTTVNLLPSVLEVRLQACAEGSISLGSPRGHARDQLGAIPLKLILSLFIRFTATFAFSG